MEMAFVPLGIGGVAGFFPFPAKAPLFCSPFAQVRSGAGMLVNGSFQMVSILPGRQSSICHLKIPYSFKEWKGRCTSEIQSDLQKARVLLPSIPLKCFVLSKLVILTTVTSQPGLPIFCASCQLPVKFPPMDQQRCA